MEQIETCLNELLKQAVQVMCQAGIIHFEWHGRYKACCDILVKSDVFTDKEFFTSVSRCEWDDNPEETIAKNIANLIVKGELAFDFSSCQDAGDEAADALL